ASKPYPFAATSDQDMFVLKVQVHGFLSVNETSYRKVYARITNFPKRL
ncbi:MAG: hypothetical protein RL203_1605, partial [Pseudomonadota bacterium]